MDSAVAEVYLKKVVKTYEKYAADQYVPLVRDPTASPDHLLAALRFIETRRLVGHDAHLRELLTGIPRSVHARDLAEACADALVATGQDPLATARFLALVATSDRPVVSATCESAARRLGPTVIEAILQELTRPNDPHQLRRLARLLGGISKVKSPEPIPFWQKADEPSRRKTVEAWRTRIAEKRQQP